MKQCFPVINTKTFEVYTYQTGLFKQNCYVVVSRSDREAIVIDPGSDADYLLKEINLLKIKIKLILLTHGHFDHIGAVDFLSTYYNVQVMAHHLEKKLIRQAGIYAYRFARIRLLPPTKITFFNKFDDISWVGGLIKIKPSPGHTSGCVCYIFESELVFTGDTLFKNFIGPTVYPTSNYAELLKSVDSLLKNLSNECIIFPGHGKSWIASNAINWWSKVSENPPQFHLFGNSKNEK